MPTLSTLMDNFLSCNICYENFNTTNRLAIICKNYHTVCHPCHFKTNFAIRNQGDYALLNKCPFCRGNMPPALKKYHFRLITTLIPQIKLAKKFYFQRIQSKNQKIKKQSQIIIELKNKYRRIRKFVPPSLRTPRRSIRKSRITT